MKNKNISCAFIASYYGPYYSNFVASMIAFEKEMQKLNNKVIYIFPQEVEKFEWIELLKKENKSIYFVPYKPKSLGNILVLHKIFKKEKINLIYSHMCGWDFTARFAAPFTPIVLHMHMRVLTSDILHKIKNWIKFRILCIGKVYHIAVSLPVTNVINSIKPHNKCNFIPNAIEFDRLGTAVVENVNVKNKKLLLFGWEPIIKGLDIAISACEIINKDDIKVKLVVSSQDKTYSYIDNKYEILPEWLELTPPTDNVSELYRSVDIMISASRSEGFSYALAEAIYMGLPVVFSNIEGTSWANEFKGTYVFKSQDVNSLVDAINKAIEQGITLDNQKYNKKKMQEKYSMDTWANKVVDVINDIKI